MTNIRIARLRYRCVQCRKSKRETTKAAPVPFRDTGSTARVTQALGDYVRANALIHSPRQLATICGLSENLVKTIIGTPRQASGA